MSWFENFFINFGDNHPALIAFATIDLPGWVFWGCASFALMVLIFGKLTLRSTPIALVLTAVAMALFSDNQVPLRHTQIPFLHRAPHEFYAFSLAILITLSSAIITLFKRRRTPDRIIVSLAAFMICGLGFVYHMVLYNGGMSKALHMNELSVKRDLDANFLRYTKDSSSSQYVVSSGPSGIIPSYDNDFINRQVNDHATWYIKQNGDRPFSYSDSGVLATQSLAYSYAYGQQNGRFVVLLDRNRSQEIYRSFSAMFSIVFMSAVIFWSIFAALGLYGHRKIRKHDFLLSRRSRSL